MSGRPPRPAADNDWAAPQVDRLLDSFQRLTGQSLWPGPESGAARARAVFAAPFALLSHGLEDDPLFNYGNRTALELFELDWDDFVRTPSRASAEAANQAARESFMRGVREHGFVSGYAGVRISASGRRFVIEDTTVWNVVDAAGGFHGQAASFARWRAP
ncbi:MAG: MEKHLA domain-containing protein [Gammaproteobacteria bacterium]|nr:MEKHLA domain-containing protein [Gammaproteobacteria bacterium]MCP5198753.1 MEKHLA domain-containing protein [Gammaproteobacteria bacterium]